jgi:hypothetical protein
LECADLSALWPVLSETNFIAFDVARSARDQSADKSAHSKEALKLNIL